MADRFVEVTKRGWGSRILGSIQGVIFGIVLFLLAFVVLWMNEGRTDISKIADDSIPVSAASVDSANEGRLVAASGVLETDQQLGDGDYLKPGPYIELTRDVQMFAWVEHTDSETETNVGGSETTTTEYSYEQEWTSSPRQASSFRIPEGHDNPRLTIEDGTYTVPTAHVGEFGVDPNRIGLPGSDSITVQESDLADGSEARAEGGYVYIGTGSLQSPRLGDVRLQYRAVAAGTSVTAFGQQQGSQLVPYTRGDATLYTIHEGDRDSAIQAMASAHTTTGWILRLVGFLMMWGGLSLVLGPISTFLDVLPILGSLSRTMLGVVAFGIAFVLSLITIIISAIAHNPIALIVLLVLILGGVWFIGQRKKTAATTAPPSAPAGSVG